MEDEIHIHRNDFIKLCQDPVLFIEKFMKMDNEIIHLYDYEKKILRTPGDRIVNKARQLGVSTTCSYEAVTLAYTHAGQTSLFVSVTQGQSDELMRKARDAYMSIPDKLIVYDDAGNEQIITKGEARLTREIMELPNGSRIISLPNNPKTARGYRAQHVYWDEMAAFDNEYEMMRAIGITRARGGDLTLISTHHGTKTKFYEIVEEAKDKKNEFKYIEIPWHECPDEAYRIFVLSDSRRLGGTQSIGFLEEYCCKAVDESTAFITREMLDASIEAYNKVIDPITEKSIELWKSLAYTGDNPLHVMIDVGRVSDSTVLIAIEDMGKYALIRYIKELPKDPLPQQTREVQNLLRHTYFTDLYIDAIGLGKHMAESLEEEFGAKINLIESFQNPVKDRLVSDMYVAIANLRILIPPIESSVEAEKLYNQLHSLRRKYSEKSHQEQYVGDKNTHDDYAFCLAIGAQSLGDSIPRQGIMAIGKDTSSLLSQDKTGKMEIIGITPKKDETKAPNMSDEEYVKKFTSREYDEPAPKERPCTSDKCVELSKKMGKPIMMKLVQNSQAKAHGSEWLCEVCWGQFYHAEDK